MTRVFAGLFVAGVVVLAGCGGGPGTSAKKDGGKPKAAAGADSEIRAALGKLSPEDQKLASAQATCPVTGEPLGSMGVPPKVTVKGEAVFLCCQSCQKQAQADPDGTLKKVAEAKAKSGQK